MKKYFILLISILLLMACTRNDDVRNDELKVMSTSIDHQTIDLSKLFNDKFSFKYHVYFIDGDDILFRKYSTEDVSVDEFYIYNMVSNDLTKILDYDANNTLVPMYLENGTIYFIRETYLNESNKIDLIMYKDGVFTDILQEEHYISKTLYFGMYDDSLSLILFTANNDHQESLLIKNVDDMTQRIIDYPSDKVIGESIYEDQILFVTADGFYKFKDDKMSNFIETKNEITFNNDFFTVKGKMDPLYVDESVFIEYDDSIIELNNSYIINQLPNSVLITEKINKEMFTKVLYSSKDDMIKNVSGKIYSLTYFNGKEIITEQLYDEDFFKHTSFLSTVNNKMYLFENTGLLHKITIELK